MDDRHYINQELHTSPSPELILVRHYTVSVLFPKEITNIYKKRQRVWKRHFFFHNLPVLCSNDCSWIRMKAELLNVNMKEQTTICRCIKTSNCHCKELTQFSPSTAISTINWSLYTQLSHSQTLLPNPTPSAKTFLLFKCVRCQMATYLHFI
jgi:hypothetical protein